MLEIRNNPGKSCYEALLDNKAVGVCHYLVEGPAVTLNHTVVDPEAEGKGIASALAKFALEDIRKQGKQVVPVCAFIRAYIAKHKEFADLVVPQ